MITIVFSHPWHGSFNHAILEAVTHKLEQEKLNYQIIDLSTDNFNPAMTSEELRLYNKGESNYHLTNKYFRILQHSKEIIFIFPIWWGMLPANLKGFFDKVLLKGSSFRYDSKGNLIPGLHISRTLLITTSQGDTELYKPYIESYLIPYILNAVGMNNVVWRNCARTSHGPDENRKNFIKEVSDMV